MRFERMSAAARDSREPVAPDGDSSGRVSVNPGREWISDWNDDPPPYLPTETEDDIERNIRGA